MQSNSDKPTRVAVIGCGFFAQNHLHAWRDLRAQGVELVAVCDIDVEKAKAAALRHGLSNSYGSAEQMLMAESLDLVDIVTQVGTHLPLVRLALNAGVAAIVQKPFGSTLAECQEMTALAARTQGFLAVHENFRFQRPNRIVSETIASGAIGVPDWARISFRTGHDIYAGQPYLREEERFIVTDLGVHVLDLARVFLGEVRQITAELQWRNADIRGEDTASMMLRHDSGAVSCVECTYGSRTLPDIFPQTTVEIEGSRGGVRVVPGPTVEVTTEGELNRIDADAPLLDWAERPWHVVQESVLRTCEHIHRRFREGRPADVSAADNLRTYELCDAAYLSAEAGRKFSILR